MTNMNSFWMQNFNNFMMKSMDNFNLSISNLIIVLSMFLSIFIIYFSMNKNSMNFMNESNELELFWTIIPTLIILVISFPSMFLLYCYEENKFSFMDVKIMGNQWYWTYEYPNKILYESYIKSSNFIRLINSSTSLIIPSNKFIRLIISSNDVLHSWSVPSLMSKMDAVPGRLNMMYLSSNKSMLLKGQCSEICGINHSFMPISVMSIKSSNGWAKQQPLKLFMENIFFWWMYQISPMNWFLFMFFLFHLVMYLYKIMNIFENHYNKGFNMKKL